VQGYAQDNPNLALLRLRSFTIGRPLADDVLLNRHAQNVLVEKMAIMVPFVWSPSCYLFWPLGFSSPLPSWPSLVLFLRLRPESGDPPRAPSASPLKTSMDRPPERSCSGPTRSLVGDVGRSTQLLAGRENGESADLTLSQPETQKTNHIVPINQVTYLNSVVMPDPANNNDDDNDSDSDDPDDNDSDDDDGDDLSDQDDESANDL
jgi:hypothetical protein